MADTLQAWFKREIVVHERALLRFIRRHWPDADEIEDIRQEAYVKVYEAASERHPDSPKSFLFAIARNVMADRIRRGRIVSIELKEDLDALNVLVDERTSERGASAREEFLRLAGALESLPPECRDVVWMRKVELLTQRDVSQQLGVPERTIEKRVARGIRLLALAVFGATGTEELIACKGEERDHG